MGCGHSAIVIIRLKRNFVKEVYHSRANGEDRDHKNSDLSLNNRILVKNRMLEHFY